MFAAAVGPCDIDANGDLIPYFWVHQFVGPDAEYRIAAVSENMNRVSHVNSFDVYLNYS